MPLQNCPIDVTPYDQSQLVKTPNLINTNYTNQDFWSMKARLLDFIKEKFGDSFSDFIESDLAIMLIENWAFIADTLSFKMDQIANEIYIDTVSELDNAFRLSTLIGFKPLPPIASRAMWSTSINNILTTDLLVDTPLSIQISTELGLRNIELFPADVDNNPIFDEPIIISSGNFINTSVIGIEGTTVEQSQNGTGAVGQTISLTSSPVIWNSIRVFVDGIEWEKVEYFTDSQPRREFRTEHDANYNGYVIFGNSRAGLIPSDGSSILVRYRVGGGVVGNVVTGSVVEQRAFSVPGFEFKVPVSFTNYTKGEFGYDGDGIEDIKRKLPQYVRTQDRAVSGDDYKILADQFATEFNGQIGKSNAILRNHGCAANIIDLYILARNDSDGLQEANDQLKSALRESLNDKKMLTDFICIKDGVIIEVDVSIDVVVDKFYKKFKEELEEKILRRVNSFFSLNNWEYGEDLRDIDLITELGDIKELNSVEINYETNNEENSGTTVSAKFYEIIRPSTININFVFE
jgi:hypothetical protein